jgi:putative membrane protein
MLASPTGELAQSLHTNNHMKRNLSQAVVTGALGGLVATWVMTQSQAKTKSAIQKILPREDRRKVSEDKPATVKAAQTLSKGLLHKKIPHRHEPLAGNYVHYAFGASMGAAYGLLSETLQRRNAGTGLLFGTLLWAIADEWAVPRFGFSRPPSEYPLETHATALGSHLVYGATLSEASSLLKANL